VQGLDTVTLGFAASFIASLGTTIGSLGVLFIRRLSRRIEDVLLSGAAGIMLSATFLSLISGSLDFALLQYGSAILATSVAALGILCGAGTIYLVHTRVPHEHFRLGLEGASSETLSRIWLFVIAITLHNFPEGLAVGVSFAGGEWSDGAPLTTGILIQNIPEGLAVAVALASAGYGKVRACTIGALSGLVEPIGGLIGAVAVAFVDLFVPWSLAFAAGAMLFVISDEIIPETHSGGNADLATFSLIVGCVLMIGLDTLL
jgi:ZIP family zinc transporter